MSIKDLNGYTISIVAKMLGVTQQTIRMYERRGLVSPRRTPGNIRLYTDEDVERLKFIQRLTQDMGVNLAGVEIILRLHDKIQSLQREKEFLEKVLREAGELLHEMLQESASRELPVKSIVGSLVKHL